MSLRKIPARLLRNAAASAAALVAASLLTTPRADADIHYTQSLTMPAANPATMAAGGSPVVHLATYVKGRRQRQETSVQAGSTKTETVVLTLCDTGQIVRMDPALKIYTITAITSAPVAPFGLPAMPRPGVGNRMSDSGMPEDASNAVESGNAPPADSSPFPMPGASVSPSAPMAGGNGAVSASPMIEGDPPAGAAPGAPQANTPFPAQNEASATGAGQAGMTGKVVLTYAVQDLGTETIRDTATHHYSVTIRRQASGCAGTGDTTTKMQVWYAPVKTGTSCTERTAPERTAPERTITTARGCKITTILQGDTDALAQVADQLPEQVKFFDKDGKEQGTMEMQGYDQASLDDALFAPPQDYRQVTASEFTRAEGQAQFQGMMSGVNPPMPAPSPNPSGAYPAPTTPPDASAGGGAFPAPTGGGDASPVNQSGAYPSPTQPAPTGNP